MGEQESIIRNLKIEWKADKSYEQQILEVLAKLKNVDQLMEEIDIVKDVTDLLPIRIQRSLVTANYNCMEELLTNLRRMDELRTRDDDTNVNGIRN